MIVADGNLVAYLMIAGDRTSDRRLLQAFPEVAVDLQTFTAPPPGA